MAGGLRRPHRSAIDGAHLSLHLLYPVPASSAIPALLQRLFPGITNNCGQTLRRGVWLTRYKCLYLNCFRPEGGRSYSRRRSTLLLQTSGLLTRNTRSDRVEAYHTEHHPSRQRTTPRLGCLFRVITFCCQYTTRHGLLIHFYPTTSTEFVVCLP